MKNPKNFRLIFVLLICIWTVILIVLASCSHDGGWYNGASSFPDQHAQFHVEICLPG